MGAFNLKKQMHRMPGDMRRMFAGLTLARVLEHLRTGQEFAVISAFQDNQPLQANLERQLALMADLRRLSHGFLPIVGVWPQVPERALFVLKMARERAAELALKHGRNAYLWGNNGNWEVFRAGQVVEPLASGKDFSPFALDEDQERYATLPAEPPGDRQAFVRQLADAEAAGRALREQKKLPAGYTCECGIFHPYPAYVYTHANQPFTHLCRCLRPYKISYGMALPQTVGPNRYSNLA